MPTFFAKHGITAILVAIVLEELGIPMPIPTDILIMLAGTSSGLMWSHLLLWYTLITLSSAVGATGLYFVVRRGGRPLVDRYGRYVHLGPAQLARAEALLQRSGWFGIALGRALPGLRYVTVIVCGLLDIPFWRFITAHIVGSSVYVLTFLLLGATFGPTILDRVHLPHDSVRLIWLVALGVGLPALAVWLARRARVTAATIAERRGAWVVLFSSVFGTSSLAAIWAIATTFASFVQPPDAPTVLRQRVAEVLGRFAEAHETTVLRYVVVAALLAAVALLYEALLRWRTWEHTWSLARQTAGLLVLGSVLAGPIFFVEARSAVGPAPSLLHQIIIGGVLLAGLLAYALVTIYLHALTLAKVPPFRVVRHQPPFAHEEEETAERT